MPTKQGRYEIRFLRTLPPGPHLEWVREYQAGLTQEEIGIRYGVTRQAVSLNLNKQGVYRRSMDPDQIALWKKAIEEDHLSIKEISNLPKNRYSRYTITKYLQQAGVDTSRRECKSKEAYDLWAETRKSWAEIAEILQLSSGKVAYNQARYYAICRKGKKPLLWVRERG